MKKEEKTEITRAKIYAAAINEFGTNGYAEGSINNICKTGINKGLIYHNFKDKDELYLECVRRSSGALVRYIGENNAVNGFVNYMNARAAYLPIAVLGDIVAIAVFFTVNAFVSRTVSGGSVSLLMIPVMIFLPIIVGATIGILVGVLLKKTDKKPVMLGILIVGITITVAVGYLLNNKVFTNITINYMLLGVAFSAAFSNMIPSEKYLGFTLLPHSGVSLVFTGIVCSVLEGGQSELAVIVKGTIAAAVINEIIAVIAAKKGFEMAGEIQAGPCKNVS